MRCGHELLSLLKWLHSPPTKYSRSRIFSCWKIPLPHLAPSRSGPVKATSARFLTRLGDPLRVCPPPSFESRSLSKRQIPIPMEVVSGLVIAEEVRFELTVRLPRLLFSRQVRSTTPPLLQVVCGLLAHPTKIGEKRNITEKRAGGHTKSYLFQSCKRKRGLRDLVLLKSFVHFSGLNSSQRVTPSSIVFTMIFGKERLKRTIKIASSSSNSLGCKSS